MVLFYLLTFNPVFLHATCKLHKDVRVVSMFSFEAKQEPEQVQSD